MPHKLRGNLALKVLCVLCALSSCGVASAFVESFQALPSSVAQNSITIDIDGNVYVAGTFQGTVDFGGTSLTSAGEYDVLVAKYNASGTLQWVRRAGGSSDDESFGVTTDSQHNCFVVGYFHATATFGNTNITSVGNADLFVAKYGSDGAFQWVRKAGGSPGSYGEARAVVTDEFGNVFVGGDVSGTVLFGTTNVTSFGVVDPFVAKYDSNGTLQWVRHYGGSGVIHSSCLRLLPNQDFLLAGDYYSPTSFGSTTLTNMGDSDSFVARLSPSGSVVWVQTVSGPNWTRITSAATDSSGAVFVSGHFYGMVSFGATTNLTPVGNYDIFVAKYSAAGQLAWAKQFGDSDDDISGGVTVNKADEWYLTGSFIGSVNFQGTVLNAVGIDVFVAKFTVEDELRWVDSAARTGAQSSFGVSVDTNGNAYVVGGGDGGAFVLRRLDKTPPKILSQPNATNVVLGGSAGFNLAPQSYLPLSLQWFKDGTLLTGATNPSLSIASAQLSDAGPYFVVLSNMDGAVTSSVATLTVFVRLSVSGSVFGQVSLTPTQTTVLPGATIIVKAQPVQGFAFASWEGSMATSINPLQLTMQTNVFLQPVFTHAPRLSFGAPSAETLALSLWGAAGTNYWLQVSTDLINWTNLVGVTCPVGAFHFFDVIGTSPVRFYRCRTFDP